MEPNTEPITDNTAANPPAADASVARLRKIPRPRILTTLRRGAPEASSPTGSTQSNGSGGSSGALTSGSGSPRSSETGRTQSRTEGAGRRAESSLTSSSGPSPHSLPNMHVTRLPDDRDEEISRLRHALSVERGALKALRREMVVQLKQVREEEQHKASLAVKDMKSRLHFERVRMLETQKDSLNRKFESELQKVVKLRDAELRKLQGDIHKLQDQLQLSAASSGHAVTLTGAATGPIGASTHALNAATGSGTPGGVGGSRYETERAKLQKEIRELQALRQTRDDEVSTLRERERQLGAQLKKERDEATAALHKLRRESDVEIRRLLDELKSKDRQLLSNEPTPRRREESVTSPDAGPHGNTVRSAEVGGGGGGVLSHTGSLERRRGLTHRQNTTPALNTSGTSPGSGAGSGWTPKSSELSSKLRVREDKLHSLEEDKNKLKAKVKELENKMKPLSERNKKLFEKNMELNAQNKSLGETVSKLNRQMDAFKADLTGGGMESPGSSPGSGKRSHDSGIEESSHEELLREVQNLRRLNKESDKSMAALKLACAEKDRRIELILHRKRKQRVSKAQNKAAGMKETYFGYDEDDRRSVDSELSLSVSSCGDLIDDEDVFEELTRDEFQQNYQRLVKEHMELENSYRLQQASHGAGFLDPQREEKMRIQLQSDLLDAQTRIEGLEKLLHTQGKQSTVKLEDTGWLQEKEAMNKRIRALTEKISALKKSEALASSQLKEIQEQNEILEFRTFELEDQVEKLSTRPDNQNTSVTFTGDFCAINDDSVLQMYVLETGPEEIQLVKLRECLTALKETHAALLSRDEQTRLIQAAFVVEAAESKLRELHTRNTGLESRVSQLEDEKAEALSHIDGAPADLVLEYESTRNQLLEARLRISELEAVSESLKKSEAVWAYKEAHNERREVALQREVTLLRTRLQDAGRGREAENELLIEKAGLLKLSEKRVAQLEKQVSDLQEQLNAADTESLAESDKDTSMAAVSTAHTQVTKLERAEQDSAKKILELLDIKAQLTNRLRTLETELAEAQTSASDGQPSAFDRQPSASERAESAERSTEQTEAGERLGEQLKSSKQELQYKVEELQALLEAEVARTQQLEAQLSTGSTTAPLSQRLEALRTATAQSTPREADIPDEAASLTQRLKDVERALADSQASLADTQAALEKSRSAYADLKAEHTRRVEWLTERVGCMEENELKLNETIVELEEVESNLRNRLKEQQEQHSRNTPTPVVGGDSELKKIKMSEQNLKDKCEQMELNEQILRDNIAQLQESLARYESQKTEDVKLKKNLENVDPDDLEEMVQVLAARESELEQEVYLRKLENEELQEQIDKLQAARDSESDIAGTQDKSPRDAQIETRDRENSKLREQLRELEAERKSLSDQLLAAKLAAVEANRSGSGEGWDDLADIHAHVAAISEDKRCLSALVEQLENDKAALIELNGEMEQQLLHMDSVERALEEETTRADTLQARLDALTEVEEKLNSSISSLDEAREELDAQRAKDEIRTKEIADCKTRIQQMRSREQGFLKLIEVLKAEKADRDNVVETARNAQQAELTELRERVDILLDSQEKLVDRIQQHEDAEDDLRAQIADREQQLHALEDQLAERENQLAALEDQLAEQENQLATLVEQDKKLATVEEEPAETQESHTQLPNKIAERDQEVEKLREQLAEKEEQLDELEQKLRKQLVDETKQLHAQIEHQEEVEDSLHKQLDEYKQLLDQLSSEKSQLARENEQLAETSEQLQEDFDQMLEAQKQLNTECQHYQAQIQDQDRQLTELELQLQDRTEQLKELENQLHEEREALDAANEKIQALQSGNNKQSGDGKDNEMPAVKLESVVKTMQECHSESTPSTEEDIIKATVSDSELKTSPPKLETSENVAESGDKPAISTDFAEELKAAENLAEELGELRVQHVKTEAELTQLRTRYEEVENELVHVKENVEDAQLRAEEYQARERSIREELDQVSGDYEDQITLMQRDAAELQNQLEDQERKHEQLQALHDQLQALHNELQEKYDQLQQHNDELKNLHEQMQEKQNELQSKYEELQQSQDQYKNRSTTELSDENSDEARAQNEAKIDELSKDVENNKRQITDYKKKIEALEQAVKTSEDHAKASEADYEQLETKYKASEQSIEEYTQRIVEYKDNEKALKTQLNELQMKNNELRQRINDLENQATSAEALIVPSTSQSVSASKPVTERLTTSESCPEQSSKPAVDRDDSTQSTGALDFSTHAPSTIADLLGMEKEALVSHVYELAEREELHKKKILEMGENLFYLRQAVELVTVALETDAQIDVSKFRPKVKDTEYEERVNQLVKSEIALKLKVIELQKKEAAARRELSQATEGAKGECAEWKQQRDQLETELDSLRVREARLRAQLEYAGPEKESAAVARIQGLAEEVVRLEATQRRLQRAFKEASEKETRLRYRLEEQERELHMRAIDDVTDKRGGHDSQRHWELLQTIRTLESSELELRGKVNMLQGQDPEAMAKQISQLERSEKVLQMKLDLLESREPSFLENLDLGALVSPLDVLQYRILEMESMERHLKEQVVELEKDREELHELARRDKATIHELSVNARQLELEHSSLKSQLDKLELDHSQLDSEVEQLRDTNQQLTEQLGQVTARERALQAQLHKAQYEGTEANLELQSARDELETQQGRLQRKLADAETEKRTLQQKVTELSERVDELEGTDLSTRQRLRATEGNKATLTERVRMLTEAEEKANSALAQLEAANEALIERVRRLEDEKSQLMYEVTDTQVHHDEQGHEIQRLNNQMKQLRERTEAAEARRNELQAQLDALTTSHAKVQARLQEFETADKGWADKVAYLEQRELNLNNKVHELTDQLHDTSAAAGSKLQQERRQSESRAEYHRQANDRLEAENLKLQERLRRFETATTGEGLSSVPAAELTKLRAAEEQLREVERKLQKLKEREDALLRDLESARQGKGCGHEAEIKDLKAKAEQYNMLVQAHELQKENYEDLKRQLETLQERVKSGQVTLKERSVKAVQVKLAEEYTIRNLSTDQLLFAMETSAEFKQALRGLGARHPNAYDDFVKLLQPRESKVSRVNVRYRSRVAVSREEEAEEREEGQEEGEEIVAQSAVTTSSGVQVVKMVEKEGGERQHWRTVERTRSVGKEEDITHPQWSAIEKNMGDTEEMTLTVKFDPEATGDGYNSDGAGDIGGILRKTEVTKSSDSLQSTGSVPPPLPGSVPPLFRPLESPGAESYYLPSADEASELEEDTRLGGSAAFGKPGAAGNRRAKSEGRDSDFSELTSGFSSHGGGKVNSGGARKGQATHSLDSIPDDSGYLDAAEGRILREKIAYLEEELRKKSENQRDDDDKEGTLKAEAFVKVKSQLIEAERLLEAERRDRVRKEEDLQSVRQRIEMFEKQAENKAVTFTLTSADPEVTDLRGQLERKDKELSAKHEELEARHSALATAAGEREWVEGQLVEARFQLAEYEAISLNHDDVEAKLSAAQARLKEQESRVGELTRDNATLRHAVDALKRDSQQLTRLQSQYQLATQQMAAAEEVKRKAQTLLTPLRAKVLRLSQQCRARDELIRRLTHALRAHEPESDVTRAADAVLSAASERDYSRPISPLTANTIAEIEQQLRSTSGPSIEALAAIRRGSSSSGNTSRGDTLSPRSDASDPDSLLDPLTAPTNTTSVVNHNNNLVKPRDKTAAMTGVGAQQQTFAHAQNTKTPLVNGSAALQHASLAPVTRLEPLHISETGAHKSQQIPSHTGQFRDVSDSKSDEPNGHLFRAIKDYDPRLYSRSGQPDREIALREGVVVKALSAPDASGYLEVQCNGKVGFVPFHYLQPVRQRHLVSLSGTSNGVHDHVTRDQGHAVQCHEHRVQVHAEIAHAYSANPSQTASVSSTSQHNTRLDNRTSGLYNNDAQSSLGPQQGPSEPRPSHPSRPTTQRSTSLSLAHPAFRKPAIPAVFAPRPSSQPSSFRQVSPAVSTTGPSGDTQKGASLSLPVSTHTTPRSSPPPPTSGSESPAPPSHLRVQRVVGEDAILLAWRAPPLDALGRSNGAHVTGYQVLMDHKHRQRVTSPFMTKALIEPVNLRRPHTFSVQTIADAGVCSSFVETVFEDVLSDTEVVDSHRSSSEEQSSTHLEGDRRVFVAVYDYTPGEGHSSDKELARQQLAFSTGDVIVTYGDQRQDGYYFAKVHGRKGLVPSSYIEEVAVLKPKSKRSNASSGGSARMSPSSSLAGSSLSLDRSAHMQFTANQNLPSTLPFTVHQS